MKKKLRMYVRKGLVAALTLVFFASNNPATALLHRGTPIVHPIVVSSGTPFVYGNIVKANAPAKAAGLLNIAKQVINKSCSSVSYLTNYVVGVVGNNRAMIRVVGAETGNPPGDSWIIATTGNESLAVVHHFEKFLLNSNATTKFTAPSTTTINAPSLTLDLLSGDCGIPGSTLLQVTPKNMEEAGMSNVFYKPSPDSSGVGGFARCSTPNSTIGVLVMARFGCSNLTGSRWVLIGGGDEAVASVKKLKSKLASVKWF